MVLRSTLQTACALLACLVLVLVAAAPSGADDVPPLDRPGPSLTPPAKDLRASLTCTGDLDGSAVAPVLLVAGTTVNSKENFGWNWMPYLKRLGIPFCASDLPGRLAQNMGDIQARGEYLVHAIRWMHERAGRRIAIMGHSQGGMAMRWALRFWPDTRAMVDDVIGFAATNHGSFVINALCVPNCSAALRQQLDTSRFLRALNSGAETFAGISYTEVYTHTDEFVQPNLDDGGTSSLHTGQGRISNVAVQEICPTGAPEHLLVATTDPAAAALAVDALTHDGPADPSRIDRGVCTVPFMPGVDPVTGPVQFAGAGVRIAAQLTVQGERVDREPPLACYATARGCPGHGDAPAAPAASAAACTRRPRVTVALRGLGFRVRRVTAGGRRLRVVRRRSGRSVVVDLRRVPAGGRVVVRLRGVTATGRERTATRTIRRCAV
ncbi:triacylglycerol lipase [Conexibacter sp. SYSU D00693]|uniref:esterase/lipase family protein n=1 Tax=Conexibacter sp. SYSU D00693 TaxID=2812560 RepID=UPI00196A5AB8|nr:hypothetical protein [Conexibacter sp. SYSU D00693]